MRDLHSDTFDLPVREPKGLSYLATPEGQEEFRVQMAETNREIEFAADRFILNALMRAIFHVQSQQFTKAKS